MAESEKATPKTKQRKRRTTKETIKLIIIIAIAVSVFIIIIAAAWKQKLFDATAIKIDNTQLKYLAKIETKI